MRPLRQSAHQEPKEFALPRLDQMLKHFSETGIGS